MLLASSMRIYFGAAIQGQKNRTERVEVNRKFVQFLKDLGHEVVSEHTTGMNKEEVAAILEREFGLLPAVGIERTQFIRRKMIEAVEGDIDAAVFEVSVPSLGTGIELAHAYLRPRLGLKPIKIIALYEKDYWPNKLSSMIRGIDCNEYKNFSLIEYSNLDDAFTKLRGL